MTNWSVWLDEYYKRFEPAFSPDVHASLIEFKDLAEATRDAGRKLIIGGNGAAAAIASHGALDFTKQAKVRALTFNESALITAYGNDYGYEHWMARALDSYQDPGDVVVLVSVSGTSPNIVRTAERARELGLSVVTFSGKSPDNPLRKLGRINFWIGSDAYNVVEAVHMIWLTTVIDMVMGKAEYSVS